MCYNSPGPRCAGHTRTLFRETKQALIEANTHFEQAKSDLSEATDAQAEAQLIRSEKLLKLAQANHHEATKNYEASKADRAEKMEAFRAAKDAYFESAEGIQSLRDAGKTDEAEKYAAIREMKLAELKRVEATKADIANGAIKAVEGEQPVEKLTLAERRTMVISARVSVEMLARFASDEDALVRKSVAMNWDSSEATLLKLSKDEPTVVASLVTNASATYPVLKNTVRNESRQIRLDTVNHPAWQAQSKTLDEHESVRGMTPHEADLEVWDATPERLNELATSNIPGIAYRVAEHRNVLPATLERLALHPETRVRNAAVENRSWPTR